MRKILVVLLLSIHVVSAWAAADEVVASGYGPSQREALTAAQRNAVEQGVGVLVDSQSLSENLMLVEDNIYAKSRGYIKNYMVISEKKSADGNWEVTIEAEVSTEQIKDSLDALGILRDKLGNPRIKVIYDANKTESSAINNSPIISEAYEGIVEHLAEMEFPVVDNKSLELVLKKEAEYLLVYNLKTGEHVATDNFRKVWIMISAKMINLSSGQVIASLDKKVLGVDKDSLDFAYRKAARKAGKLAAHFLVDKWAQIAQSKTVSGREVFLELSNTGSFSLSLEFKNKLQKTPGVRNIILRNSTPKTFEYEVTYIGDIDTLKENAFTILKKMGLKPEIPITSGDRISIEVVHSSR